MKDPVYGSMEFSEQENRWIKPFIDSENFQRLRHIKQLGLADWIFPGAVHTRFSHSLGCCYVAGQIAKKLEFSEADRQLVMIAALLHDIGHGPFSHTFEFVFHKQAIHHEMWTPQFLADYAQESFLKKFNQNNPDLPLDASKIQTVQNLIMHKQHENKLLADVVSSQLDADRLDYLLRDSYFCGVEYGRYDFRWLLYCMTPIEYKGQLRLGVTNKGIGAVEHYLMARRLMMRNIAHHGKKLSAEFLLTTFLKQLAKAIEKDPDYFVPFQQNKLIAFLKSVNQFNKEYNVQQLSTKVQKFLKENYSLYRSLCDYDVISMIRDLAQTDHEHEATELAKRLYYRRLPKVIHIREQHALTARKFIAQFKEKHEKQIRPWQIKLLHLPHLAYAINDDPILIKDFSGAIEPLHDTSQIISAISNKYESAYLVVVDIEIAERGHAKELLKKLKQLG